MIAVSIVSHGHGPMVSQLVAQLLLCPEVTQIIVTRNLPEALDLPDDPRLLLIDNALPKGFAANHNAAFTASRELFFCALNPDIELSGNPFQVLMAALICHEAGVVSPLVKSPAGEVEDYARHFPNLRRLTGKLFGGDGGRYALQAGDADFQPDWVAGMFMLFPAAAFSRLGGFDEGFALYYEDVDICVRAWQQKLPVLTCPSVSVIHDARRDSRRKLTYLRWHLASMARYFFKHWGRLPAHALHPVQLER